MNPTDLGPTESALVDVIRVALSGDIDGVQQLCRRYIRRPPTEGSTSAVLKKRLVETVAAAPPREESPLRGAASEKAPRTAKKAALPENRNGWVQQPHASADPVYGEVLGRQIESLVREHLAPDLLAPYGLAPSRAVLFTGPPGVGKSLTAAYVASRLQLPLMTVNIASIMSSLMGKTGQNIQDVLEQAAEQPTVLFLDEFDALAKSRDDSGDVGEVRRVVNVVLQQLDRWPAGGLLIAATNHPQLLDTAVHRRFDLTVSFQLPTLVERAGFIRVHPIAVREKFTEETVLLLAAVTTGFSQADLDNWIHRTVRRVVLSDNVEARAPDISGALLIDAESNARTIASRSSAERSELAQLAHTAVGWSHRQIADWLGVTHPTIGKDLRIEHHAHE